MQKYVLMSTNWPDTRGFFPSKTSISFKIRHKLTLLPYMSNILCLYKQFALYFEWKCHIFGKNWCTGELTFHRWIGEIISPVFHRCTSVEYLTLRTTGLSWTEDLFAYGFMESTCGPGSRRTDWLCIPICKWTHYTTVKGGDARLFPCRQTTDTEREREIII